MNRAISGKRRRVIVVAGGDSAERDISLLSGATVTAALRDAGREVEILDPRETALRSFSWQTGDVAFLSLHGTYGEDGGAQQDLRACGVRYTGSGVTASRLAFDKLLAKQRFVELGLPTPEWRAISCARDPLVSAAEFGCPLIVKPTAQGSSLGVSLVDSHAEFETALNAAREFGDDLFLERAIPGEDWTVAVLNGRSLPPIRVTTPHVFFDFTAKYAAESTDYNVIQQSRAGLIRVLRRLAERACDGLGCRGVCRVDFRVDPQHQPWLLEVNTLPGMTSHSLVPKSALAAGWSLPQLCEEIVRAA